MKYTISKRKIHITDSYKITNPTDMRVFLKRLKIDYPDNLVFEERTIFSLINEWCAHNILYQCDYKVSRTKDCDLDTGDSKKNKFYYFLLRLIYPGFKLFYKIRSQFFS